MAQPAPSLIKLHAPSSDPLSCPACPGSALTHSHRATPCLQSDRHDASVSSLGGGLLQDETSYEPGVLPAAARQETTGHLSHFPPGEHPSRKQDRGRTRWVHLSPRIFTLALSTGVRLASFWCTSTSNVGGKQCCRNRACMS